MRIVVGALCFALCAAAPTILLSIAAAASGHTTRPDPVGDFLLAGYIIGSSAGLCTLGFLIPTAFSTSWRRMPTSRVMIAAGILGLLSPIATLLVLALTAKTVLPFFRTAPWLALVLTHGLPGVVLGAVAVLIATMWKSRNGPAPDDRRA